MKGIISLEAIKLAPTRDTVLRTQGIPEGQEVPGRVTDLVEEARDLYEVLFPSPEEPFPTSPWTTSGKSMREMARMRFRLHFPKSPGTPNGWHFSP